MSSTVDAIDGPQRMWFIRNFSFTSFMGKTKFQVADFKQSGIKLFFCQK
jgi:hypothetical protein